MIYFRSVRSVPLAHMTSTESTSEVRAHVLSRAVLSNKWMTSLHGPCRRLGSAVADDEHSTLGKE